ncbi:MAG: cytochrome c [Gammaproteobacteria bacterium]|nr:cytochrome c [Gammaproteobacteria bacterium]
MKRVADFICTAPAALRAVLAVTLLGSCGVCTAGDVEVGRMKAEMVCQTCHGMNGRGTQAMVANIGGQQQEYLVKQLTDFKEGRRQHPQMSIIAGMLSSDDIANVATWYSRIVATFEVPGD